MAGSCQKKSCEEPIPEIEFNRFELSPTDSGSYVLIFDFIDCDGDMGLSPTDSIRDKNGEFQTNNFFIDFYYSENDEWVKYVFNDNEPGLSAKIPILSNSNLNPVLEGEIERKLSPIHLLGYDTVRFNVKILDNAGNYSNEVMTPGFILN